MSDTTIISGVAFCDICKSEGRENVPAKYDGKTQMGPWAYMCPSHYSQYGVGLGTGKAQKLVVKVWS